MPEEPRERSSDERSTGSGPVGTMLGLSLGPFGAAVGSVVDDDRLAFKLSVGTGGRRSDDDELDGETTIEIGDDGGGTSDPAGEGPGDVDDGTGTTEREER